MLDDVAQSVLLSQAQKDAARAQASRLPSNRNEKIPGLSIKQLNAIELLIRGYTDREVAKRIRVTRQTVCTWRNHNSAFISELNLRRQALWGANTEKLRGLAAKAIEVLNLDLDGTDYRKYPYRQRAAVHILRSIGMYGKHLQPQSEISSQPGAKSLLKTCPTSLAVH
jgi:DNA-binding CsgD family transcriptional regulator